MPRWLLECIDTPDAPGAADRGQLGAAAQPTPVVVVGEHDADAARGERRRRGRPGSTTHMLVASGIGASRGHLGHPVDAGSRDPPGTPADPRSARRPRSEVATVHAAFGSRRSGRPGNASRSARIAAISSSRREHPALELDRAEAVLGRPAAGPGRRCPAGSSASPYSSARQRRMRGPLVEQVGGERRPRRGPCRRAGPPPAGRSACPAGPGRPPRTGERPAAGSFADWSRRSGRAGRARRPRRARLRPGYSRPLGSNGSSPISVGATFASSSRCGRSP